MKLFTGLFFLLCSFSVFAATTAITIALEPDSNMQAYAKNTNDTLRATYPQGYALDNSHYLHMTLVQMYVQDNDLEKVYDAVEKSLKNEMHPGLTLETDKFASQKWDGLALVMLNIKSTHELEKLRKKIINAVKPYAQEKGDETAFLTTPEDPKINQETMDHVRKYIVESAAKKYKPNLTLGVTESDSVVKDLNKKKEKLKFSAEKLSVFKMGNFGTAREKLREWKFE